MALVRGKPLDPSHQSIFHHSYPIPKMGEVRTHIIKVIDKALPTSTRSLTTHRLPRVNLTIFSSDNLHPQLVRIVKNVNNSSPIDNIFHESEIFDGQTPLIS